MWWNPDSWPQAAWIALLGSSVGFILGLIALIVKRSMDRFDKSLDHREKFAEELLSRLRRWEEDKVHKPRKYTKKELKMLNEAFGAPPPSPVIESISPPLPLILRQRYLTSHITAWYEVQERYFLRSSGYLQVDEAFTTFPPFHWFIDRDVRPVSKNPEKYVRRIEKTLMLWSSGSIRRSTFWALASDLRLLLFLVSGCLLLLPLLLINAAFFSVVSAAKGIVRVSRGMQRKRRPTRQNDEAVQ